MKGLKTLIKLQKSQLDELRQAITKLEEQRALQEQLIEFLQLQLIEEEKQASEQIHLSQFFGDFSKRIKAQQNDCRAIIAKLNKQIEALQAKMRDAFGELKKLEITEIAIQEREKAEALRREQENLDEIALQQYLKKQQEGA